MPFRIVIGNANARFPYAPQTLWDADARGGASTKHTACVASSEGRAIAMKQKKAVGTQMLTLPAITEVNAILADYRALRELREEFEDEIELLRTQQVEVCK